MDVYVHNGETLLEVEWDSVTLQNMPEGFIIESMEDGLDWHVMNVLEEDVEKTNERDKKSEVKITQDKLENKYYWKSSGEEGKRIE